MSVIGDHGDQEDRDRNLHATIEQQEIYNNCRLTIESRTDTLGLIRPEYRSQHFRLRRLNTMLLEAIEDHDIEEVEKLLNEGASPNATCRLTHISVCHLAAMSGSDALSLLIKFGAEKFKIDKLGRTPLHLAAWAGNSRQVAILLDFPEEIQDKVDDENMSSETEEEIKKFRPKIKEMIDVRCDPQELDRLKNLTNNFRDGCRHIKNIFITYNNPPFSSCTPAQLPVIESGWTPLHAASFCARKHCARLLLAAGANANVNDAEGRTPLDVTGNLYYQDQEVDKIHFTELIKMLLNAGGQFNTMRLEGLDDIDTPIHTAVEMGNMKAIKKLLDAGAVVSKLNRAGQTPLHLCVKKELERELFVLANYNQADFPSAVIDVIDREGRTVLQVAIQAAWVRGVYVALESGADVTLKANDENTPIHSAAALGNIDVLKKILSYAKDALDYQNLKRETALIKAIIHGHEECVNQILRKGASIQIMLPGDVHVFHIAADYGHVNILRKLLEHDEELTKMHIDTAEKKRGFAPIHFAVFNNHKECVDLLLIKNANTRCQTLQDDIRYKGLTPLHIAAIHNYADITGLILKKDKESVHELASEGLSPLLLACENGSRDVIPLLLQAGANLSQHPNYCKRTAIDMIMHKFSKPTEFMEGVFDSCISSYEDDLHDPNYKVTVNYEILMPIGIKERNKNGQEMKVIEALLKTGNRYGQRKLLVHPLVESFLCLKWKALLPFFYTIITFYGLFLGSLTIFIISAFFYKDTNGTPPDWLNTTIWSYVVYATTILVIVQELLYINVKSTRYLLQLETGVKFGSLALAVILPYSVVVVSLPEAEWPRHVATLALLLSWLEMMLLLSRFLDWGYYVLMFGKVASDVVKILLTFMCLIVGFSLSFMVQFRSQMPFEGPWAAFVKTIVMMSSELDYGTLFNEKHSKELATSLIIVRIIFLVFLISAVIVLMNLLVGVAVNNVNDLETLGKISRLAKQVEFHGTLDSLVYNGIFSKLLPRRVNDKLKRKIKVQDVIILSPRKVSRLRWMNCESLPSEIRDSIFNIAKSQMKQTESESVSEYFTCQECSLQN